VGTLYGWGLSGRVPARYDYSRHGSTTLLWPDGREESWPETAFVRTSHLTHDERRDVEKVVWELERQMGDDSPAHKRSLGATVRNILERPVKPPCVTHRVQFPDAGRLQKGEKYLLHRWLLKRDEKYRLIFAYPVWLVVMATDGESDSWLAVRTTPVPSPYGK
jgi:hypothetical protein